MKQYLISGIFMILFGMVLIPFLKAVWEEIDYLPTLVESILDVIASLFIVAGIIVTFFGGVYFILHSGNTYL